MTNSRAPMAIVGIGCRFPGGADAPGSFWQLLKEGVDAICDVPEDRWDIRRFHDPDPAAPGRMYTRQGGFLRESIWDFDAPFFGITPREASVMDPQQRLLLEVSFEAIEDAGLALDPAIRRRTGVFVGAFCFDNAVQQMGVHSRDAITTHTATSASMVMLSNRISYVFDLQGPSFTVDTACSSSLVATHLGCQALRNGECDVALIGGVNVMLRPESTILECKGGFLSPDARCRTFDASASGYVRGEGAGVVIIRPLAAALQAGDRIYAVIRATGVNQDGRTPGITVPRAAAQSDLIRDVCASAGVRPSAIGVVEAHGTGTAVGDPIEANALGEVLREGRAADSPAWVGSVKTNMGHLEAAAGVAGLIKASLCLHHQQVVPHLHLREVNPKIDLEALKLRVPSEVVNLGDAEGRYGVVNSFGYGGTNAHVLLERAPPTSQPVTDPVERAAWPIPLSARPGGALQALAGQMSTELGEHTLPELGHALSIRRNTHDDRAMVLARDRADLERLLRVLADGGRDRAIRRGRATVDRLVWVYTGMGSQSWGMGRALAATEPVFRDAIAACDAASRAAGGPGVSALFMGSVEDSVDGSPMPEPQHAQPANLALQVGLTEVLRSYGLRADAVVGHSVGEIAAAWAAGALTLEQAFFITQHRCTLQQEQLGRGTMLVVDMPAGTARKVIMERAPDVEIAAFNSVNTVALGGTHPDLAVIAAWCDANAVGSSWIRVGVAYHTRQMDPMRERFLAALASLKPAAPRLPLYSTLTGSRVQGVAHDATYWWDNARQPVALADALGAMGDDGYSAFLEVGPHPVLGGAIRQVVEGAQSWATLRRGREELDSLDEALGDVWANGIPVDWRANYPSGSPDLRGPRYPWQRERLWSESAASRSDRLTEEEHPLLHRRLPGPEPAWESDISESFLPWLGDHCVSGARIFPGAGFVVAALAAAKSLGRGSALESFDLTRAMRPETGTRLRVTVDPRDGQVQLHGTASDDEWVLHARGRLPDGELGSAERVDLEALRANARPVDVDALYARFATRGLQYGEAFRCLRSVQIVDDTVVAELASTDPDAGKYGLHPTLLDASFQALLAHSDPGESAATYVPVSIEQVRLHAEAGNELVAVVRVSSRSANFIVGEIRLCDSDGSVVAEVSGLRCQRVAGMVTERNDRLYGWQWKEVETPLARTDVSAERWLVLDDAARRGAAWLEGHGSGPTFDVIAPDAPLALVLADRSPTGIIDLRPLDAGAQLDPTGEAVASHLLELARILASHPLPELRRLMVVTRGVLPVAEDGNGAPPEFVPSSGTAWGLARVMATELGRDLGLVTRLVDLPPDLSMASDSLLAEVCSDDNEDEVALRRDLRFVGRLQRWAGQVRHRIDERSVEDPVELSLETPGVLNSFRWRPAKRRPPGPGEVEIRVHKASLNFKDLMKAMNMLSAAYMEQTFIGEHLGMECSGVVVDVGKGVEEYKVGDEVVAIDTNGCFRSYHTAWTGYMAHKPAPLSFAEAPSLIAYVTPYYALKVLANVQPGETVVLHSAAGGVGLAAIEVCRWLGAEIIATAGTDEKRELLRSRGVEHVFDSRSLLFAEQIMEVTGGRGVDVVLNSLSGEAARRSLAILAPYGRFIEIGKKDIAEGSVLGLADFDRNLMFVAVDTDRMGVERPKLFRSLIDEVIALLADRTFGPVPVREFAARDAADAFRFMARAKHVGKIVVDLSSGSVPVSTVEGSVRVKPDRTWLITGGLGGFGVEVARWLADEGATHLVLVGRSGASRVEALELLDELTNRGVEVRAEAVDVSDRGAVDALIATINHELPPVQGVVHGAMVLDDGPLESLDAARLSRVLAPKALGAWNLHCATAGLPLEAFVMFSSVATFIGNPGQGAYVAANHFLDTLAWHRHSEGLPALTVNWGAISDAGVVSRNRGTELHLESMGIGTLTAKACTQELGRLLELGAVQVGVAQMDWRRWQNAAGAIAQSPRFSALVTAIGSDDRGEHPKVIELRGLQEEEQLPAVLMLVRDQLAAVMHTDANRIDVTLTLDNMGVDSLMGVELASALKAEAGVELSALVLMQGMSVNHLAAHVLELMLPPAPGEDAKVAEHDPAGEEDLFALVEGMSEAELDVLLASESA